MHERVQVIVQVALQGVCTAEPQHPTVTEKSIWQLLRERALERLRAYLLRR